ncbi:MAG TPA: protein-L-isoaspartate O-methyltransferase, partial [Thermodesulfobacteriota bacterium]
MDTIVKLIFIIAFSVVLLTCSYQRSEKDPYLAARQLMVKEDIQRRGIDDQRVLQAMLKVERHLFVPDSYRPMA